MSISRTIGALKAGKFVLVHDDKGRENEIDMVVAAEHITPEKVGIMRRDAGGLLCLAIANEVTSKLGLPYMHDMIASMDKVNPLFSRLVEGRAAYGDKPSFSISVNHRNTFTGITDKDRALTISEMAKVCKRIDDSGVADFAKNFRAPGHVPLLIAAKNLLSDRNGHTELCVYLMRLAGMTPAVAICEMMDSQSHGALSLDKALDYAGKSGIPLVEASELKEAHQRARVA